MTIVSLRRAMLAFGLGLAVHAQAEPLPFAAEETFASVAGLSAALATDLDADGDEDVLVARTGANGDGEVGWLRNDRSGFAAFRVLHVIEHDPPDKGLAGDGVEIVVMTLADLDLDRQPDLVVGTADGEVFWIRRDGATPDGQPNLGERGLVTLGLGRIFAIVAGRFGQDQFPDLVIGNLSDPFLLRFDLNSPFPIEFGPAQSLAVGNTVDPPEVLVAADLDDDGRLDLVYGGPGHGEFFDGRSAASLYSFNGTADGSLLGPTQLFGHNFGAGFRPHFRLLRTAPLDPDGPALVYGIAVFDTDDNLLSTELRVQGNAGDGDLDVSVVQHSATDSEHLAVAIEDLDRNGSADLLVARSDALVRIERPGLPTPEPSTVLASDGSSPVLLVFDVDLDGDRDLVRARANGDLSLLRNTRLHGRSFVDDFVPRVAVDTTATGEPFADTVEIAPLPPRHGLAPASLLFTEFAGGKLHRTGSFVGAPPPVEGLFNLLGPSQVLDDAGAARRIATGDFDLDGYTDFLLGSGELVGTPSPGQNRMVMGLNRSEGFELLPIGCTAADDLRGVAAADINRDGTSEIVYAAEDNDRIAVVFRPDCIGEILLSTPELGIPNGPNAVAIADLDGDLFGDIVVAARLNDDVDRMGDLLGWYRFSPVGGGGFEPLRRIGQVNAAREITVVDLDRDGRPDLVTSAGASLDEPDSGAVLLFRNLGPGVDPDAQFAAPQVLVEDLPEAGNAAFSDIDHDGDPDLFVASEAAENTTPERGQCGVSFAEQIGPLQFAAPRCLDRGDLAGSYTRVALADVDGNGVDDIGATSFPDQRLGFFAGHRPFQYLLQARGIAAERLVGEGTESCPWLVELDHLGRANDGPMGFANLAVEVLDLISPSLIGAFVLRRDDGDGLPEPDQDTELARSAVRESNELGFGVRWNLNVAPGTADATVLPGSATHWLCVLGPDRIADTRLRLFGISLQAQLRDIDGDVPVGGLLRNAPIAFALAPLRVFSDGLE